MCGSARRQNVSIHATLAGGDLIRGAFRVDRSVFLSTPPSRVATQAGLTLQQLEHVSIHATLAGGDAGVTMYATRQKMFLSTPPSRVATHQTLYGGRFLPVSIHATLAGGDTSTESKRKYNDVSIHATLAGGDFNAVALFGVKVGASFYPRHPRGWRLDDCCSVYKTGCVSIHATLAGGDLVSAHIQEPTTSFLSTPPSRVATSYLSQSRLLALRFYPRHPRGWRPSVMAGNVYRHFVSIHATLAGGDPTSYSPAILGILFLSTPPSRVATVVAYFFAPHVMFLSTPPSRVATAAVSGGKRQSTHVSIHATLAGGDFMVGKPPANSLCFYPRHPRGWRQPQNRAHWAGHYVSIHATLAGGDPFSHCLYYTIHCFYPRHPRGWRRLDSQEISEGLTVSIHATLAGGDLLLFDFLIRY